MWRKAQQAGSLLERFLYQRELAEFQISQPAVDESRRIRRRPERQIGRIDKPNTLTVQNKFASGGSSVDSATQNHNRLRFHLPLGLAFDSLTSDNSSN